jgi:hypothetical protein
MKRYNLFLVPIVALILATSCEVDLPTWSGEQRINFVEGITLADTTIRYSFVFSSVEVEEHTLWLEIATEGLLPDVPRRVDFVQVLTGNNDAEPGIHYVPFNDPRVKDLYVVPARTETVKIPIILLRHASLKEDEKILRIELVENNNFLLTANTHKRSREIIIADKLTIPKMWAEQSTVSSYFGEYGPAKHRFMIDNAAPDFDDKWFDENWHMYTYSNGTTWGWVPNEPVYMNYLRGVLLRALGTQVLYETDGTRVTFPESEPS